MAHSMIELAAQLARADQPFVLATVVWCERPTSAKPGAQAIIQEDGRLTGWVGGSCTQPVVTREARRVLREGGEPFLLRLGTSAPDPASDTSSEVRVFSMTCASGGALDIYMEPHLPQPRLLLIGNSPILGALQQLAPALDFSISQLESTDLAQANIDRRTSIIIATHGQDDETVLERVLASPAAYIGMVSSPRRAAACRDYLRASGMAEEHIARLRAPVGLDIGARTPEEIAISIIAELIQQRHGPHQQSSEQSTVPEAQPEITVGDGVSAEARDPVCGMSVEIATARHISVYNGDTYYFCCPACKRTFEREPASFLI
jgi:xanthine dehydrogenase accessory factor